MLYHPAVSLARRAAALVLGLWGLTACLALAQDADADVQKLRAEVAAKGWLLFSARSPAGDYDLFRCRPDGTDKRAVTQTPEWTEFGARLSPDQRRLLYRRLPKSSEGLNHDLWGAMGTLVIANADGSSPQPQGKDGELPWASWSPDGKQVACLSKREGKIRIVDLATKQVVKEIPRNGIFQQLFWSGDGQRLCGTANLNGRDWNVVTLDLQTGQTAQVSRSLACTPDWFAADPKRVIYSCRIPGLGTDYGWTILMEGTADGASRTLLYGERGRHIYYGGTSPDDQYAVFSVPESDGGTDAEMVVMRRRDAPIVVPADFKQLQDLYPSAKTGPVLHLGQPAFEPFWTYAELGGK